jgi:hypothetical protein
VQSPGDRKGFVEMPYTLPQDFTLLVLLREQNNAIWRKKLDWIAAKGGMALLNTHPDYMSLNATDRRFDRYPVELYTDLLDYVRERYGSEVWIARPSEVAAYWKDLQPLSTGNGVQPHPELCKTCYQAHSEGWVQHYRVTPDCTKYFLPLHHNRLSIPASSPLSCAPIQPGRRSNT